MYQSFGCGAVLFRIVGDGIRFGQAAHGHGYIV